MKYNEEAYNMSARFCNYGSKEKDNTIKQDELLQILLKRFLEELEKKEKNANGILRARFNSPFWQESDPGYNLIQELVDNDEFDFFASQYCMYLGDTELRCDERYTAFYEIIWDYKTYFEYLNLKHNDDKLKESSEYKFLLSL